MPTQRMPVKDVNNMNNITLLKGPARRVGVSLPPVCAHFPWVGLQAAKDNTIANCTQKQILVSALSKQTQLTLK